MVKLYYTPTSCGAASFISAYLAGVNLETEVVDIRTHQTASGADYYAINPKGNVPTLVLDNGEYFNEGAAVLQYIADQNPGTIAPPNGTIERYHVINALNYVASEVHPSIGINFFPATLEGEKEARHAKAATKLAYLNDKLLNGKDYLANNTLSIADIYLYIVLTWTAYVGIDLSGYENIVAFNKRISENEKVKEAQARMATNPSSVL